MFLPNSGLFKLRRGDDALVVKKHRKRSPVFFRWRLGFWWITLGEKLVSERVVLGVDGVRVVCGQSCEV